ncbi:peptide/nickel transport system ATP-binding protein [Nonomuraea wenchangensis]|uniref:Peptide/nickel transport system ATP-binding protein n=2 Tax=Nonomuraea wenchangensis TaxID=568860 RepID=A0A1I0IM28_9ACTN|nr:peptide/nickel transport system ATP-binding protein [Nonomuraea wenchangensis]
MMLRLDHVTKVFRIGAFGGRTVTAVKDVSFDVAPGEVVSLIGESGSGKSTLGRLILGLSRATGGTITFDGRPARAGKDYYRDVQGIFQDPFSSFNPVFKADRVFAMIKESYHPGVPEGEWAERVRTALRDVRLNPDQVLGKFPHQLSGGQLQRLLIARALLLEIRLLVADEITSMLDASTRIDVLNLLAELKTRGLGVLYITHDLSLGNYLAERTIVLREGAVVEMGPTGDVFGDPLHPYTRELLSAVPRLHEDWADAEDPGTCLYHERGASGGLLEAAPGHLVACARSKTC